MVVTPVNDCDRNARLFQFSDNGESTEPSPYHDDMMFFRRDVECCCMMCNVVANVAGDKVVAVITVARTQVKRQRMTGVLTNALQSLRLKLSLQKLIVSP